MKEYHKKKLKQQELKKNELKIQKCDKEINT